MKLRQQVLKQRCMRELLCDAQSWLPIVTSGKLTLSPGTWLYQAAKHWEC